MIAERFEQRQESNEDDEEEEDDGNIDEILNEEFPVLFSSFLSSSLIVVIF